MFGWHRQTKVVLKPARFISQNKLACDSFPDGSVSQAFNLDKDIQVTVSVMYALAEDLNTILDMPLAPDDVQQHVGEMKSSFTFFYKHGACADGVQNQVSYLQELLRTENQCPDISVSPIILHYLAYFVQTPGIRVSWVLIVAQHLVVDCVHQATYRL